MEHNEARYKRNAAKCGRAKEDEGAHRTQYHRGDGCNQNPVPLQQALHISASPLFLSQHIHNGQAHGLADMETRMNMARLALVSVRRRTVEIM